MARKIQVSVYKRRSQFAHFVTDFSLAIPNGTLVYLNNQELIDCINDLYYGIVNDLPANNLIIILHICINHFMKKTAKDVDTYFPPTQSSTVTRTFLKKTLAPMFNLKEVDELSAVYERFSIILNSKYISEKVTAVLDYMSLLANKTNKESAKTVGDVNDNGEEDDD